MSERKRKSLPICERLRGVRRGERERESDRIFRFFYTKKIMKKIGY